MDNNENTEKKEIPSNTESEVSFEDCCWNKYDLLHKRFKRKLECLDNNIEIFTKLNSALKDFSKDLNTILSKNYILYPEENYTQNTMLDIIKKNIEFHMNEINKDIEVIKNEIITNVKKKRELDGQKEKEIHNQFTKCLSKYNDSKSVTEKFKQKYHQATKIAESSIKFAKSMIVKDLSKSQDSAESIKKAEQKASELSASAKKLYDKYVASLKDTNQLREEFNAKQKKLLSFFKEMEFTEGELLIKSMNDYMTRIKTQNESNTQFLTNLEEKLKDVDIQKDFKELVNLYNSNGEKPEPEILFEQYNSDIILENSNSPEEFKINYELIVAMKKNITQTLFPDLDMEKESQKQEMRDLCKKIFITNIPFTDEEKKKLMEYLGKKWEQDYFLVYLSKQRTSGRFSRSEKLINDLSDLLKLILNTAEKNNDYVSARSCLILSQTYYYETKDGDNTKKKYLLEYVVENNWIRTPNFWRGLINEMIKNEIDRYEKMNPGEPSLYDDNPKSKSRLSNICFSQLLPYTNNMIEFYLDERAVLKIDDEMIEKYHIDKDMAGSIYGVVCPNAEDLEKLRQEYKNNPDFENNLYSLEEMRKRRHKD